MKQNTDFMSALMVLVKPLEGFLKLAFFSQGSTEKYRLVGMGRQRSLGKQDGEICLNREFILVHVHIDDIPVLSLSNKNRYL